MKLQGIGDDRKNWGEDGKEGGAEGKEELEDKKGMEE